VEEQLGHGAQGVDALSIAMAFPDDFTTLRMTAERLRLHHAEAVHRMHSNVQHMAFIGGVRSETQTAEILLRNLAHWDTHGFGVWVVRAKDSRRVAGRVLLRVMPIDGVDEIELGYSYDPEYWGQGIATEVAKVCMAEAQTHCGFSRFVAVTNPANSASQHVLRKLGFMDSGQIEQDERPLMLFRRPDALESRPRDTVTMRTSST
jgi:ribosomal-protein-alanine N-acetyltransferase